MWKYFIIQGHDINIEQYLCFMFYMCRYRICKKHMGKNILCCHINSRHIHSSHIHWLHLHIHWHFLHCSYIYCTTTYCSRIHYSPINMSYTLNSCGHSLAFKHYSHIHCCCIHWCPKHSVSYNAEKRRIK